MSFVGISPSDIGKGLQQAYKVADVIVHPNKVPDEVDWAEQTSRETQDSLKLVEKVFTPTQQAHSHVSDIQAHAGCIAAKEKQHCLDHHRRYGKSLSRDDARQRMRALREKLEWTFQGKKAEEEHQRAQQGPVRALQTGIMAHIVQQQHDHLTTTERAVAQGEAHFHSIIKRTADSEAAILQTIEAAAPSLLQQGQVLERVLETKFAAKLDDICSFTQQQQIACHKSMEEIMWNLLQSVDRLDNKLDKLGLKGNDQDHPSPPEGSVSVQTRAGSLCRSNTPRARPRRPGLESSGWTRRISVLRIRERSLELSWRSSDSSTAAIPVITTNQGGSYMLILLLILAACCEIGLELGRYISSQALQRRGIPRAVSFLLSDNIYFTDALGRDFRLSIDQTSTWGMLNGWLREQFKGCPGASKVERGQFFVFDPQNPDSVITQSTWTHTVGPRRRFQMGIVFSHTQMSDHCRRCARQKQRQPLIRAYGEFNVRCPTCGTLYSSSALGSLRPMLSLLARTHFKKDTHRPWNRKLPYDTALAHAPLGMERLAKDFARLVRAPDLDDPDLDLDLNAEAGDPRVGPRGDDMENLSTIAYANWKEEKYHEEPEEELVAYGPSPQPSGESDEEQRDFDYFKVVWVNSDTRLHDAALRGDCGLAQKLISEGHDPNQRTGSTGSPLIAAVVSGSHEIVKLLLDQGADPLLPVHQGHTPVSAAACHATDRVGYLLFPAAFRASYDRPAEFQDAVDRALYESTTRQHEWHNFLLFIGANPAASFAGPRQSAIAKALVTHDDHRVPLLESFLMVLWERRILTDSESRILARVIKGEDVPLSINPEPWLRVCCAALRVGDPAVLVRVVNRRIRKKPDHYFRLNISNMFCHPDMQRFWRSREDERQGIVVSADLAGIRV